jgi:hypothetical protein
VGVVHLGVVAIALLQQAPAGVAVERSGGVVEGGPRLGQRKEVQPTPAVKKGNSRNDPEEEAKQAGRH